jgi:hypothetical protein
MNEDSSHEDPKPNTDLMFLRTMMVGMGACLHRFLEATTDLELSGPNANFTDVVKSDVADGRYDQILQELAEKYASNVEMPFPLNLRLKLKKNC